MTPYGGTALAKMARERDEALRENERLREALEQIASCESHVPGDVVDIARQALALASRE